MNDSVVQKTNHIFTEVQKIRQELENMRNRKSQLKLNLFYDSGNQELLLELDRIRKRNYELNLKLNNLNNELYSLLNMEKQ